MSTAVYGLLFFASILVVILIHEAGHFTVAKAFGIKVEEFFVGFGPRIWSTRRGETEYGVKALPLGGYVKIAGMNPAQPVAPEDVPRSYASKPPWQRALVIVAGPMTHFLIAILVLIGVFAILGVPTKFQPFVARVELNLNGSRSPAALAGVRSGDAVLKVGPINTPSDDTFRRYVQAHAGQQITVVVQRSGRAVTLRVTPALSKLGAREVGLIGVRIDGGKVLATRTYSLPDSVARSVTDTGRLAGGIVAQLGNVFGPRGIERILQLLGGAPRRQTDVSSVVGVSRAAGQAVAAHDWFDLALVFVTINIFVGILNLVPLPPFDGGHLAVVVWEKLTHRPVDQRRLMPVAAVVLGFVVLFSLSVLYLDIVNPLPNPFR